MSTQPPANPSPHAAEAAGAASALAILGATALGSLLASRVNRLPLVLGAGAAALALWRSRESRPAASAPLPPPALPEPPPSPLPDSFVHEWLERQRQADEAAPSVPLPGLSHDAECADPQDIYVPLPLLPDEETPPRASLPHIYARLTEPPTLAPAEVPLVTSAHWTPPPPILPIPSPLPFEPLPALREEIPAPEQPPPAPVLPTFTSVASSHLVFQGGDFPDHIEVEPPEALIPPIQPFEHIEPSAPQPEASVSVPEIAVELASPGEASFDPPLLDDLPASPWSPPVPEPQSAPPADLPPVIADGEIVLRPLPQGQSSITPRAPSASPRPAKNQTIVDQAELPTDTPTPAPVPFRHRSTPSWNSWWQGD